MKLIALSFAALLAVIAAEADAYTVTERTGIAVRGQGTVMASSGYEPDRPPVGQLFDIVNAFTGPNLPSDATGNFEAPGNIITGLSNFAFALPGEQTYGWTFTGGAGSFFRYTLENGLLIDFTGRAESATGSFFEFDSDDFSAHWVNGPNSYDFSGRWQVDQVYYFSRTFQVPEPSTWALMILGFGATGAMIRRRRLA